jgi:hypothetical protein
MAVSEKPRKKRSKVVAIPMHTPPVQLGTQDQFVEVTGMEVIPEPQPNWYPIDWNKVTTIQDIKIIISNMGLGCAENAPNYNELKKYLSDTPQASN